MAYYPDWAGPSLPPENINFNNFDWIDFAFALPDDNFALTWDDPVVGPGLLQRLVAAAHANTTKPTKIKLSIGGWGGSKLVAHDDFRFSHYNALLHVDISPQQSRHPSLDKSLWATSWLLTMNSTWTVLT
jgi:GH18 family chitinase